MSTTVESGRAPGFADASAPVGAIEDRNEGSELRGHNNCKAYKTSILGS